MNTIRLALCVAGVSMAAVPHKFSAGSPASADSVNANFGYLDNALKSKADTTALNAVKASIPSAVNLSDFAKTSAVSDTASKVRSLIPSVSGFATAKSLADSAMAIRSSIPSAVNLTDYAKTADVSKVLAESTYVVRKAIPSAVNLSEYAKTSAVSDTATKVRSLIPTLALYAKTADVGKTLADSTYAVRKAIPSISGLATTTALTEGLGKKADLTAISDMATKTWSNTSFAPSALVNSVASLEKFSLQKDASNLVTIPYGGGIRIGENDVLTNLSSNSIVLTSGSRGGPVSMLMTNNQGSFQLFRGADGANAIFDADVNMMNVYVDLKVSGTINGKVVTNGIRSSDVADYVFEPDYKLASLPEIEAFTKANKHLPEVPSAAEIEKGGLDLAKMNLTLLKKVEELTLHAIAQNKQLEAQAAQIQAQNERLQALEANRN